MKNTNTKIIKGSNMRLNAKMLKAQGCSDEFIVIVEKNINTFNNLNQLENYINELEEYKSGKVIHPFEQDILDHAKRRRSILKDDETEIVKVGIDDSTEEAIRKNEFDYNGDVFETMGYEMFTDDGQRY
jgi:hypothetical protein